MAVLVPTQFLTPFVGRDDELRAVSSLVRNKRLVTLLGTGGLGKTRLGYRLVEDLAAHFSDAAWCVDLADVVDPGLVGHTVGQSLGLSIASADLDVQALVDHIGDLPALLYIDNCEHLLDACAALTTALLASCRGLHVLTSSRQALGVLGEHVYAVSGLKPDEAVELFVNRASAALPTWAMLPGDRDAVDELCRALEGMPLAIELAAIQIRTFSPQAILVRLTEHGLILGGSLRGEPTRRTSLEACIRWSYDLCTPPERLLWGRLSVFGGFPLDAVEVVCQGSGLDEPQVIQALAGLVDKSLVERVVDDPSGRYRMLEVIRQFGAATLSDGELLVWRDRHRDYYLALSERFDAEWAGPHQIAWMRRLRLDHANLRLAIDYSVTHSERAATALRMCSVLEQYFASSNESGEALHWLQRALAHGTGTAADRAAALRVGCFLAALNGALDSAGAMYDELVTLADETQDDLIRAYLLYSGAVLRTWQGDAETGAELGAQGVTLLRALGDVVREANLHFLCGVTLGWAGRTDEAAAAYHRCIDLTEPRGELWIASYARWGLGVDALRSGDLDRALRLGRTALKTQAAFGNQLGIGLTLELLAWVAAEQRRAKESAVLLGAAAAIWEHIGSAVASMPYLIRRREAGIAAVRVLLSPAAFDELFRHGRTLPQAEVVDIALGRSRVGRTGPDNVLTPREREIAALVTNGMSNREMADLLVISVRTVETHVENVLRKLDLRSRGQLAAALVGRVETDGAAD